MKTLLAKAAPAALAITIALLMTASATSAGTHCTSTRVGNTVVTNCY